MVVSGDALSILLEGLCSRESIGPENQQAMLTFQRAVKKMLVRALFLSEDEFR